MKEETPPCFQSGVARWFPGKNTPRETETVYFIGEEWLSIEDQV
jgi:hypothetical protein